MNFKLPDKLTLLAANCGFPLYAVGGSVRDYLAGFAPSAAPDWDICAAAPEDEFINVAERCGFTVKSVFRNTGTVKLSDGNGQNYEFTRFRSDKYVRGVHAPSEIEFTSDMEKDARRRDFTVNAIYYEIDSGAFRDPLGGVKDIENKTLRTVAPARKVFGEDGLRLMRLARQSAETGFLPDEECAEGAKKNCSLINDIVPERIFAELTLLLHADAKHGDKDAPYRGLKVLHETGVLKEILPELALGDGLQQRSDFHDHDVLEHSLRCVKYSAPDVRFAALFHDVGKPFCYYRDGNVHAHAEEGARITEAILTRLKAPKKLTAETAELVRLHMRDYDLAMKEGKIRREIVEHYPLLEKLFSVRQADYSACKDDLSPAPSVVKWKNVLAAMRNEGVPLTIAELKIGGKDLLAESIPPEQIGTALENCLEYCLQDGSRNERKRLLKHIGKLYR